MENLTIATGGFCYVGDQTHSWLAATQYIAPLMANFDTISPVASIMYATNKTRMVVTWNDVKLMDNPDAGTFTFQVSLWDNGDIWFVYKDVSHCLFYLTLFRSPFLFKRSATVTIHAN